MKLSKKYLHYMVLAIMALIMTAVISFVMTFITLGFVSDFVIIWVRSVVIGFIVAYPIALVALPLSQKIVNAITE